MAELGKLNHLTVLYSTPQGIYLGGGDHGEILLPNRYVPRGTQLDDVLEVFVYRDSEDRLIATTEKPFLMVGESGPLKVVSVNRNVGAFLDWGLPKDLLLPFRQQAEQVFVGDTVIAHVMVDDRTDRIIATTKLNKHISKQVAGFKPGQQVSLVILAETPLGYNALVEGTHQGLLYHSQIGARLQIGQQLKGFVSGLRPGGKLDLTLDAQGYKRVAPLTDQIFQALKAKGGALPYDDESSPEEIRRQFDCSKKAFKQALGALFRQRRIRFTNPGIAVAEVPGTSANDWSPGQSS
ncbi:MAG TPA: S1-like domain-containing RNA-binding protein [Prosthecobacter sp.]